MIQDYKPEDLIKAAHDAGAANEDSVEPIHKAEWLKETGKDLLAKLMTNITTQHKMSEAERERIARGSEEWEEFRIGQELAIKAGLLAKIKAQNAQRLFEAIQSALSYRKEEMRKLGGQP